MYWNPLTRRVLLDEPAVELDGADGIRADEAEAILVVDERAAEGREEAEHHQRLYVPA